MQATITDISDGRVRSHLAATRRTTERMSSLSDWTSYPLVRLAARRYAGTLRTPEHFVRMLLLIEDKRFLVHPGVDPIAVIRAMAFNARGGVLQGASTVIQQLYNIRRKDRGPTRRSLTYKLKQSKARNLLAEFRTFLTKAYVVSTDYPQNRKDYFWFVTNVPFACSEGSGIKSYEFVKATLSDKSNSHVAEILGNGHVDDQLVRDLVDRLGVFILTDSYLRATKLSYKVRPGESLWTILKRLYGGSAPGGFRGIAEDIARKNGLQSPDRIISGKRLKLDWQGMRGDKPGF